MDGSSDQAGMAVRPSAAPDGRPRPRALPTLLVPQAGLIPPVLSPRSPRGSLVRSRRPLAGYASPPSFHTGKRRTGVSGRSGDLRVPLGRTGRLGLRAFPALLAS